MRENYESPVMEIVHFIAEDVITASSISCSGDCTDWDFGAG